jgi:hypothetical protein
MAGSHLVVFHCLAKAFPLLYQPAENWTPDFAYGPKKEKEKSILPVFALGLSLVPVKPMLSVGKAGFP